MTDRENTLPLRLAPAACAAAALLLAAAPAPAAVSPGTQLAGNVTASPAVVTRALQRHTLHLLDGTSATLSAGSGQVVVVNFWATWCRPCVHELPALEKLEQDIASRGGRVMAVAIDEDRRNVARFAKTHALTLPIACDGPAGLARELDLQAVPLTIVLDRSGQVAWCSSRTDEAGLADTRAAVERALARPASPPASPAVAGDAP